MTVLGGLDPVSCLSVFRLSVTWPSGHPCPQPLPQLAIHPRLPCGNVVGPLIGESGGTPRGGLVVDPAVSQLPFAPRAASLFSWDPWE